MSDNDLQPSGLSDSTRTDSNNQDKPARPRRAWTKRMAQQLGLHVRLIQKMLEAGAPDATDQAADSDWPQFERAWRGWIITSRRWRSKARQLRAPLDLDHAASVPDAGCAAAAGGGDGDREDDPVKRRKCVLLDLQIARERGQSIDRTLARELLLTGLNTCLAVLDEVPGLLAQALPAGDRDTVRAAGKRLVIEQRARVEREIRALWKARMPALLNPPTPPGVS